MQWCSTRFRTGPNFMEHSEEGVRLIGFADNMAMIVVNNTETGLMESANRAINQVSLWMERRKLELTPEKTEAALLTIRRKIFPIHFNVQGTVVRPSRAVKYLGVWLYTKLTFVVHVSKATEKAERIATAVVVS